MVITIDVRGSDVEATLPHRDASFLEVPGVTCDCGKPLQVRGTGIAGYDHDTYFTTSSVALCCGATFGRVRCRVDTIFGIDEDRAMLQGRPRVY